jgi:hypothetical protein
MHAQRPVPNFHASPAAQHVSSERSVSTSHLIVSLHDHPTAMGRMPWTKERILARAHPGAGCVAGEHCTPCASVLILLALAGRKANPGSGNSGGSPGTAETEESQSASGDHHNGGVGAAVPHAPQRHAHEPGWAQGEAVAPT